MVKGFENVLAAFWNPVSVWDAGVERKGVGEWGSPTPRDGDALSSETYHDPMVGFSEEDCLGYVGVNYRHAEDLDEVDLGMYLDSLVLFQIHNTARE